MAPATQPSEPLEREDGTFDIVSDEQEGEEEAEEEVEEEEAEGGEEEEEEAEEEEVEEEEDEEAAKRKQQQGACCKPRGGWPMPPIDDENGEAWDAQGVAANLYIRRRLARVSAAKARRCFHGPPLEPEHNYLPWKPRV